VHREKERKEREKERKGRKRIKERERLRECKGSNQWMLLSIEIDQPAIKRARR